MVRALTALMVALLAAPASGAERSGVDPARRRVWCEGRAAPRLHEEPANVAVTRLRTERAARDAAARVCLATIRALATAEGTVGDRAARDEQLARALEAAVRSARIAEGPRLFSDGGVALRLDVPLDGRLARWFLRTDAWTAPLPRPAPRGSS